MVTISSPPQTIDPSYWYSFESSQWDESNGTHIITPSHLKALNETNPMVPISSPPHLPPLTPSQLFDHVFSDSAQCNLLELTAIIAYYGRHYSTFCHHSKLKEWIYFDDAKYRTVSYVISKYRTVSYVISKYRTVGYSFMYDNVVRPNSITCVWTFQLILKCCYSTSTYYVACMIYIIYSTIM